MAGCLSLVVLQLATMINMIGMNYSWTDCPDRGRCEETGHEKSTTEPQGAQTAQQGESQTAGSDPGLALHDCMNARRISSTGGVNNHQEGGCGW